MDIWGDLAIIVISFAIGAAIGSFLNVVIYRIPANISLIHPPSRCPRCLTRLRKRENIPIVGWLLLRGKCAHCGGKISPRYPLIELITALLFTSTVLWFGFSLQTFGYWILISWLLSLAMIDLDTLILPNVLTQSGLAIGLAFQSAMGIATHQTLSGGVQGLLSGLLAAVAGLWLLDVIAWLGAIALQKTVMGGGDAKLLAMIGAWLGLPLMLLAGFLACLLGAVVGVGAIVLRVLRQGQAMPFGPFLALGALLTMFWGQPLLTSYLKLFAPPI
ncbi:MAG: prepilin peptidase [Synechococcales bacterium]|nr:prepilin peptidase [Synechococcales bacterium]